MDSHQESKEVVELARGTLQANKEHLLALKTYTQKLEAELETVDKLLDSVDTNDESDLDAGCFITIPGSVRAATPLTTRELISPESPFYQDALKRSRYQDFSEVHPMKHKELEVLGEAVWAESCRKHALKTQTSGFSAFPGVDAQKTHVFGLGAESIDWDRVAEKVSATSLTPRTARECEIRWLGEQHPSFNHEPWSQEEVLKVKSLVESTDSRPDWVEVAKRLGTKRTPLDCMRHAVSRRSLQWTTDVDERLRRAIRTYGHENWHLVARYVSEDATPSQCSHRFRVLDESIKRTNWSPEEDARLSTAVAAYGSSWVDVAASIPGRHGDQCRGRWTEQLNPSINKSQWSDEEDRLLLDYVREHKDASWKEIAESLGNGRTQAICRNRYAALQKYVDSSLTATPVVNSVVQVASVDQGMVPYNLDSESSNRHSLELFPEPSASPATSGPPHTGHRRRSQIVFLEPVVSSNPESHRRRRPHPPQRIARFKTTTSHILPSNTTTMPPTKKRKTRSHVAKSRKPSAETQHESTS